MVTKDQQAILNRELVQTGLDKWHKGNIKGKSLRTGEPVPVLIAETIGNAKDHARRHINRFYWGAPEVKIYSSIIQQIDREQTVTINGVKRDFEEFIATEKIKIVSCSVGGPAEEFGWETDYFKMIRDKYRVAFYNSAGNNHYGDGETLEASLPACVAKYTTACLFKNGIWQVKDYSSAGKQVDYTNVVGWDDGTSFASPVTALEAALIVSRYDDNMCMTEITNFQDMICTDVWKEGLDEWSGLGIPIMPNLSRRYITFKIGEPNIFVNGNKASEMDVPAVIVSNRTFVPIRVVAELLGWNVSYITNPDKSIQVKIQKGTKIAIINTGSRALFVNGITLEMDAPAFILNGRTMIPFRFIASILSGQVNWVPEDKKVTLLEE